MSPPMSLQLTVVGTNHKHAPIDIRERLWFPPDTLAVKLQSLTKGDIDEAVILSTCNRTEVYTISAAADRVIGDLKEALSAWSGITSNDLEPALYALTDEEATKHLISVTSGLDSLAIGEQQIQEQVRQALRIANRAGTSGRVLSELFKRADTAASKIRKQSGFEAENISISSAITILLRQLSSERRIRTILLIGAGKMISLAAEDLSGLTEVEVLVANRTAEKARNLADRVDGRAVSMADIPEALESADVVLTCTSAGEYVVRAEELRRAVSQRGNRELVVIDVAVPRNVDPAAKHLPGLRVYDIDDLAPLGQDLGRRFQNKLGDAERLVDDEVQDFHSHLRRYEANDLLKDLRKVAEQIREEELSRALRKLGDVPAREKTILELLTHRIVNKLLYEPTSRLKAHATEGDGEAYEAVIRELFDIGRPNEK